MVDPNTECIENGDVGTEQSRMIPARVLTESLLTLCNIPNTERLEGEAIAMETLIDSHHPCISK